ncbi:hypothetical protein PSHI8_23700 [Polynucleobacter sp. SHI8]|uniref:YqjK-like family protein n=1 Tax=unclassified Polynucleobacter TaxID=2640945 RepID=UPI00249317B8|nr:MULTISPECIES: YqjK-like family protein [unclassified Polynucleobacter]BDW12286.1 hypothetical protein PSHI2_23680 [Polynucleobacter sp. SHI2]BDW14734.1 hypothetical protein PSHI8_23700 [Polynucleobacter sp. SHI8]
MTGYLKDLKLRRRELQAQSNRERKEFGDHFEAFKKPISWADKGLDALHFLKNSPLLWTTAFTALVHYKPKMASKVLVVGQNVIKFIKSL